MNETNPESTTKLPDLALGPLEAGALTPGVQKVLASPTPMKLMAAKGIAALRPAELLTAVYQLSFDADAAVKAAAEAAPATLPDKVVVVSLGEALPAPVLHFFALKIGSSRIEAIEKILDNQATADETFVALASTLAERELEIIFENEMRILRFPAILQALFFNPQARMSSVNRAIELCARHAIRLDGIPAYDEIVKAIAEDRSALDPAVADENFAAGLDAQPEAPAVEETAASVAQAEDAAPASPPPGEAPAAAPKVARAPKAPPKKKTVVINFSRLKLYEKIRLATLGNEYCRQNLVRDPNRLVAMAAIRSPKITDGEIIKCAGSKTVSEEVIRYIAGQRDLVKSYQVRLSLVENPKCPVTLSLRFLGQLQLEDLKKLSKSKNVPAAIGTTAKRLVMSRGGGG